MSTVNDYLQKVRKMEKEQADIRSALRDLKNGRISDEDKKMLKQALNDLKEMNELIQELGEDFSRMGDEISTLEREAQKAIQIDEEATEDMEIIIKEEIK